MEKKICESFSHRWDGEGIIFLSDETTLSNSDMAKMSEEEKQQLHVIGACVTCSICGLHLSDYDIKTGTLKTNHSHIK